jgi:RNA polymerase sigma-70 factor (family 1)
MTESIDNICAEQTFQKVHLDHGNALRNFLYYKLGDLERARDIAQDAFIKLWNNCQTVSLVKAKSYLFTVANRLFLDDTAHQKVSLKFQKHAQASGQLMGSDPEKVYRENEFKEQLEEAISGLPEKQRVVFLMSRIDKMSNQQIADTLEVSIKTVEKHITNSLKNLRDTLDELKDFKI